MRETVDLDGTVRTLAASVSQINAVAQRHNLAGRNRRNSLHSVSSHESGL